MRHTLFAERSSIFLAIDEVLNQPLDSSGRHTCSYIRGGCTQRVYLDYLQNLPGKTVATAYRVRANRFAGISTPLRWEELSAGVRAQDFAIQTLPDVLKARGDLWATLRQTRGIDVHPTR